MFSRKDKRKPIKGQVVVESVTVDHLSIKKINNHSADVLKFSDGNLNLNGSLTFWSPVTVKNNLNLEDGGYVNRINLGKHLCGVESSCSGILQKVHKVSNLPIIMSGLYWHFLLTIILLKYAMTVKSLRVFLYCPLYIVTITKVAVSSFDH